MTGLTGSIAPERDLCRLAVLSLIEKPKRRSVFETITRYLDGDSSAYDDIPVVLLRYVDRI